MWPLGPLRIYWPLHMFHSDTFLRPSPALEFWIIHHGAHSVCRKLGHVRCQVYQSSTSPIANMVGFTKVENSWKNKSFYIRWSLGSRPRKEDACVFQMPLFSQGWKWNGCFPTTTYCCFGYILRNTRWWNTKLLFHSVFGWTFICGPVGSIYSPL